MDNSNEEDVPATPESKRRQQLRDAVRTLLRFSGWTPSELARRAKIAPSTLNRFLNQPVKHLLSTRTLDKIFAAGHEVLSAEQKAIIESAVRSDGDYGVGQEEEADGADKEEAAEKRRAAFRAFVNKEGLVIADWARRARIPSASIYNFLNGVSRSLSQETLERLAGAAGVNISDIAGNSSADVSKLIAELYQHARAMEPTITKLREQNIYVSIDNSDAARNGPVTIRLTWTTGR